MAPAECGGLCIPTPCVVAEQLSCILPSVPEPFIIAELLAWLINESPSVVASVHIGTVFGVPVILPVKKVYISPPVASAVPPLVTAAVIVLIVTSVVPLIERVVGVEVIIALTPDVASLILCTVKLLIFCCS